MNPAVLSGETSIFITFLASILIWLMFAGLVFMWVIDGRIKREQALHALFSALIAWALTLMIKSLIPESRPFILDGSLPMTLTLPSNYSSFPSAHSAVAFALATSVWIHNKKLGLRFIIIAILVGMGRIMSNVHFLHDVWVGAAIGIATASITKRIHLLRLVK
jgi:undecaprenyl-diphosphatase